MTNINALSDEQRAFLGRLEYLYGQTRNHRNGTEKNELYDQVIMLDKSIRNNSRIKALLVGLTGLLLFITGYNFLTRLQSAFLAGIIFFSIGVILIASAYPIYNHLIKKKRKKYAPVVLTITNYLI